MTKQMFLIDYESSQWCGGGSTVVVWAQDEDDASEVASWHMEEAMRELFSSEYDDLDVDGGDGEDQAFSVNSVELFDQDHPTWKYFEDPSQAEFYPVVGSPE